MPLGVSEKVQDFSRVFQGCYGFESLLLALIAATRAEGELVKFYTVELLLAMNI